VGKGGGEPDPPPSPVWEFEPQHPRSVLGPGWHGRAANNLGLKAEGFHPFRSCWKPIAVSCPQSCVPQPRRCGVGWGLPRGAKLKPRCRGPYCTAEPDPGCPQSPANTNEEVFADLFLASSIATAPDQREVTAEGSSWQRPRGLQGLT